VREQQKIYLIIEHCPSGDMGALIDAYKKKKLKMEEVFIWRVLGQILLALQSCHNREEVILHRDLKPANILLDEDLVVKVSQCTCSPRCVATTRSSTAQELRRLTDCASLLFPLDLCHLAAVAYPAACLRPCGQNVAMTESLHRQVADFGLAAVVNSDSLACSKVGTPLYMAPEQIQGAGYTAKSDMWALGCIIYEVLGTMLYRRNALCLSAFVLSLNRAAVPSLALARRRNRISTASMRC
jgi:serine/threonine protein kinase